MEHIRFSSIVEKNGRTIYENRSQIPHNIPIGTLCEVKYSNWYGDGACQKVHARLWVVAHHRDCDGSPLYALSERRDAATRDPNIPTLWHPKIIHGIDEAGLTPMEMTPDIRRGVGDLNWDE